MAIKSIIKNFKRESENVHVRSEYLNTLKIDIIKSLEKPTTITCLSQKTDLTAVKKSLDTLINIVKR